MSDSSAERTQDAALDSSKDARARGALVIGEALIDIVETARSSEEFVGGGPNTIAVGLARRDVSASLLAWIAHDDRGQRIAAALKHEGVTLLPDSWGAARTPTALAQIQPDGSAVYQFDIEWAVPQVALSGATAPALIHAGSIGLFIEPGAAHVLDMLQRFHGTGIITLDPNIRPSLLPDHGTALAQFERAARLATLVKLSDEDAAWLYPKLSITQVAARICDLGPASCVLTLGADGAYAQHHGRTTRVASYPVTVADTISAGDSFMASLITGLLTPARADRAAGPIPLEKFQCMLDDAARSAALAVSKPGAAPPTSAEVAALPSQLARD